VLYFFIFIQRAPAKLGCEERDRENGFFITCGCFGVVSMWCKFNVNVTTCVLSVTKFIKNLSTIQLIREANENIVRIFSRSDFNKLISVVFVPNQRVLGI
jgi:hypothetical protein